MSDAQVTRFAGKILAAHRDFAREPFGDVDGADIEQWAVECGLLAHVEVKESCGEDCNCAAFNGNWPAQCLRLMIRGRECIAAADDESQRLASTYQAAKEML